MFQKPRAAMPQPALTDPYAALRFREFRFYVVNSFLLTAGLLIQEVIVGYEIYKLTNDPLSLGLVGLAEALPYISIALFGGYLADRLDKRRVMQTALLVIISCSVVLYFAFRPDVWTLTVAQKLTLIYAILVIIGAAKGFYSPASSSMKPQLVPRELYANSSAWSSQFWQAGAIGGPAIAGFLYVGIGLTNTLAVVVAATVVGWVSLSMISPKPSPAVETKENIWSSLREGIKFVYNTKIIFYSISLDLISVLFGGVIAILPIFAQDILHVGAEGLGILRAAPSVGAVLTMFVLTRYPPTRHAWRNMLLAVAGFGIFTLVFALSTNFMLSIVALFMTGAFDSVSVLVRQTVMQVFPPDHMRGRVNSVNGIFVTSSNELGAFESGLAAKLFGTVPSVVGGGVFTLLIVAWVYTRSKELLKIEL